MARSLNLLKPLLSLKLLLAVDYSQLAGSFRSLPMIGRGRPGSHTVSEVVA
jgi:hypothetical protein